MKRIIECEENGGFEAMLGESVVLLCGIYIYAGTLSGVSDTTLELTDAVLVYETGEWGDSEWTDAQPLPGRPWRVQVAAIESWGPGK